METIGQRLLELRKKRGYTQEDLAGILEVSRQSISNWELDKSLPDTERLFELAKLYEVSLDEIAYGKKNIEIHDLQKEQSDSYIQSNGNYVLAANNLEHSTKGSVNSLVRTPLIFGLILTTVLLVSSLILTVGIIKRFAKDSEVMNSEIAYIDEILEQYSYVEVSKLDGQGNYAKERVWLDTRNLSEGDSIFCFTPVGKPRNMKFEYYSKTLVIPFCISFALVLLECVFVITLLSSIKGKKKEEE